MRIRFKKLREGAREPVYGTPASAGADLYACLDEPVELLPGETRLVPYGIAVEIPDGYVGLIFGRSGIAMRRGLAPSNKVAVIDSDYRGELMTAFYNQSPAPQRIEPGERVAQLVIVPYVQAAFELSDALSDTGRGEGGFGSTGTR